MSKTIQNILAIALFGAVFTGLVIWAGLHLNTAYGSVSVTDEYLATSTAANAVYGATITGDTLVKTGAGVFGSYVITGANTGVVNVYNATTTVVGAGGRAASKATSTILLASFPASIAAGTYTFDVAFTDGLYFDLVSGAVATGTLTYRNN